MAKPDLSMASTCAKIPFENKVMNATSNVDFKFSFVLI
jgi:hypothetical protein